MGMFATIEAYCFKCQKPAFSQTKLPDELFLQTLRPGDVVCPAYTMCATGYLSLKNTCGECHSDLVIELRNGIFLRTANEPAEFVETYGGCVEEKKNV